MNLTKIISGSISGTLFMTLFSYLISSRRRYHFKEPIIFNLLLGRVDPLEELKKSNIHKGGWLIHYLAGLFFSSINHQLWTNTRLIPGIKSGTLLGATNGIIGVIIWRLLFKFHPDSPNIKFQEYYGHILAAHIIFGIFNALGYRK